MNWIMLISFFSMAFDINADGSSDNERMYTKRGQITSLPCFSNTCLKYKVLIVKGGNIILVWEYENKNLVTLDRRNPNQNQEKVEIDSFDDRLKMNVSNGDITISSVDVQDEGMYHCFMLVDGVRQDCKTYILEVVEVPNEITIYCTESNNENAKPKPCDNMGHDEVSSITCSIHSRPKTKIQWYKKPDCEALKQTESESYGVEDGIYTSTTMLSDVCNGTYQCNSTYVHGPYKEIIVSESVVVLDSGDSNGTQNRIYLIVIPIVIAVILSVVVVIIGICYKKRARNNKKLRKEIQDNNEIPGKYGVTRRTGHILFPENCTHNQTDHTNSNEIGANESESKLMQNTGAKKESDEKNNNSSQKDPFLDDDTIV